MAGVVCGDCWADVVHLLLLWHGSSAVTFRVNAQAGGAASGSWEQAR